MQNKVTILTMLIVALVSVSTIAITSALGAGKGTYDWTGIWNTSRGKMVLVQKGSIRGGADVTGTVTLLSMTSKNQVASLSTITGSIVAVVMDDKLAGTWSQPPSYGPPKDAGDISFIISKDGKSFTGTWRYGYATGTPPDGQWTGTRVGPAKPPQNPPSVPLSKQTVSASAKPSITEGSVFKRAEFTIGGTQPLTIKVIQPAENFAIKEAYGKVVYQVVDGKSWGSKTLEPGDYVLSCNGGGAMGLMSASVSIEYPVAAAPPTGQGGDIPAIDVPPKPDIIPPGKETKPTVPLGPIERIIIRSNLSNKSLDGVLQMEIGKKAQFSSGGVDAAHPKHERPVIVDEWTVSKKSSGIGSIDKKTGDFTAGPQEGVAKIMAKVGDLKGVFHVNVTSDPPITFRGRVQLFDEQNNLLPIPASGVNLDISACWFKDRKAYDNRTGVHLVPWFSAPADTRGRYWFTLPGNGYYYVIAAGINEYYIDGENPIQSTDPVANTLGQDRKNDVILVSYSVNIQRGMNSSPVYFPVRSRTTLNKGRIKP